MASVAARTPRSRRIKTMNAKPTTTDSATTHDSHLDVPHLDVPLHHDSVARATAQLARVEELLELAAIVADEESYTMPPLSCELPADFRLSIVIPVYNEERTIAKVLKRVALLPVPRKEIVVVDDCSSDRTAEVLQTFARDPEVVVIRKPRNEGKGAALRTGFHHVSGDVVVVQDADLEYDPRDILQLLPPLVRGETAVVYGSRFLHDEPQDKSWLHRFGNWSLTAASNLFTGLNLTDMETCYKAFRREVIQSLPLTQDRFGFEPEVTARLARRGIRIREVPIGYQARSYAEGKKIGVKDLFNALWCITRYGLCD
jgi:glycosyltransferase involved in cell wall biosynthesis